MALGIPLLILGVFLATWWFDTRNTDGLVARGVTLSGMELGGATEQQAGEAVDALAGRISSIPVMIEGPGELTMQTTADRIGLSLDSEATLDAVMRAGERDGGLLAPIEWVRSFSASEEVRGQVRIDPALAAPIIDEVAQLVKADPGTPTMSLQNGRLVGIPGPAGRELDTDAMVENLTAELPDDTTSAINLVAPLRDQPPEISNTTLQRFVDELNANTLSPIRMRAAGTTRSFEPAEVRSWLQMEVMDNNLIAVIDEELVEATVTDRFGDVATLPDLSTLDIVNDKPTLGDGAPERCCGPVAEPVLAAILAGETDIELPLIEGGDEALEQLGIVELVAEFTTEHPAGQDRVINIQRMADLVSGAIIGPGDEFSINDHVGRRTTEKGFVPAGVISYGVLDTDVGGGVSQFATTMFNTAFFAGFDIPDYTMHSLYFDRYPYGREATLSFPEIDLRIVNPSEHYFLLWTEYTPSSITVKLFGTVFAEVEDLGTSTGYSGQCRVATTTRQRTFVDGRTDADEFSALYQPAEGLDCNGESTLPQPDCAPPLVPVDNDNDGRNESCGVAGVQCLPGEVGFDSDGDGAADFCQVALTCPAGQTAVDLNADGIADVCQPTQSTVSCPAGTVPFDTNADGIADSCQQAGVSCGAGTVPVDLNNDGIADTCEAAGVSCPAGQTAVDTNADGITDTCQIDQTAPTGVSCGADQQAVDTNGDGVTDTCQFLTVGCPEGYTGQDTTGDGQIDWCIPNT